MIDKKEFSEIRKELESNDTKREQLIRDSRDIIRISKRIIYAILRDDFSKAEKLAKTIKSKVGKLPSDDYGTGAKRVALQEYAEAITLLGFAKSGKIPSRKALGIDSENYLAGLSDLTGELVRMAVNKAIKKDYDAVLRIKRFVEEIYGEFLQFNLRNSELRKKSDQIKWNLQKLEDMAYGISKNE